MDARARAFELPILDDGAVSARRHQTAELQSYLTYLPRR